MSTVSTIGRIGLLAGSTGILLLAGCGGPSTPPRVNARYPLPQPPLVATGEPGRCGGELRLTLGGNPKNFNPLTSHSLSQDVTRLLFAGLTSMDWQTQEIRPALAESWRVEADSRTWTFKLRRGLRWSDGQPLTADDVVFTWNDVIYARKAPAYLVETFSPGGTNFLVSKVDETTVRVVTPAVFAPFVEFFGSVPVLPRHVFDPTRRGGAPAPQYENMPFDQIACSGPFRLLRFTTDSSLVLERNPEYWVVDRAGQRLPYVDHVIFTINNRPGAGAELFLRGAVDAADKVAPEEFDALQRAAGGGKIQLLNAGPALDSDVLWFNQNTNRNAVSGEPLVNPAKLQWFRNQKFRQAVSLSIDRDRIARTVYAGRAEASQGFCSAALKKWNHPGIARATYDPVRARRLFAEIGLADRNGDSLLEDADGNTVEILFNTNLGNPTRLATARRVVEDLRQAGLRVDLQTILFPELGQRVSNSTDYDLVLLGLGGGGADPAASVPALRSDSPACPWFPSQPSPSTDWEARLDTLLDEQMHTLDFAQRKKAFDEVQSILAEQLPLIDLVAPAAYTAVRPGIGNVRPSALTPYRATWNLEEWYWK